MIWTRDPALRDWLPKLQAHRGLWVEGLPQNSLESIQAAAAAGYAMSEFDVRMTSDGVAILFHDDRHEQNIIRRTALAELRKLTPVTTLEELFNWFAGVRDFKLNIEIKSRSMVDFELEKKVCELVSRFGIEDRVLVSSFNPLSLYQVRKHNPGIYRALLLTYERNHGNNLVVKSRVMNYLCRPHMLNLRYDDFSERFKKLAQKIPVVLWTVNELDFYKAHKGEIHGIISDRITPKDI